MQIISPVESRKLLDAMNIPVVLLRDRCVAPMSSILVQQTMHPANPDFINPELKQKIDSLDSAGLSETKNKVEDNNETEELGVQEFKFSLVSAVSEDVLLVSELPKWAGGMLEGRLTGLCADVMRVLTGSVSDVDWQYFHWPIKGIKDQSQAAALQAVDAWLHRRWAETDAVEPLIVLSVAQVDLKDIFLDALFLPTIEQLAVSPNAKREAWEAIKERIYD